MTDVHKEVSSIIEHKNRLFEKAFAEKDAKALVEGYFADDSLCPLASPPGATPPVRGRANLMRMFSEQFAGANGIRLETVELVAREDMAYEMGRAHLALANGEAATGRYAVLWLKDKQDWRARIDFFSPDGWQD